MKRLFQNTPYTDADVNLVPVFDPETMDTYFQEQPCQPIVGNWRDYSLATLIRTGNVDSLNVQFHPQISSLDEVALADAKLYRDMDIVNSNVPQNFSAENCDLKEQLNTVVDSQPNGDGAQA